jgi:hypothetical protein
MLSEMIIPAESHSLLTESLQDSEMLEAINGNAEIIDKEQIVRVTVSNVQKYTPKL